MNRKLLEDILEERILSIQSVSCGDISIAQKVKTESKTLFIKSADFPDAKALLESEEVGLKAIKKTNTIEVPKIFGTFNVDGLSCLILEYIEAKSPSSKDYELLGRKIAQLHSAKTPQNFGFDKDNFIGRLPQKNTFYDDWTEFYVSKRLETQIKMALDSDLLGKEEIPSSENILVGCQELIGKVSPSLLHGDLWSGNYLIDIEGTPYLIDPAVHYGHNEMDLAMTKLFGGFSDSFYGAYHEMIPNHDNQNELIEIYQLYYLLVHLNLFGTSYKPSVLQILEKYF